MDFDLHFTEEDEEFRKEVRAWLEENIPANLDWPVDPYDTTPEQTKIKEGIRRGIGAKGWFAPDVPKEYGGGGMPDERVAILAQEFNRMSKRTGGSGASGILGFVFDIMAGPIMRFGPEWMKKEIVPRIYSGQDSTWLNETEPEHGTDNAAIETTAILDGDEYVVNGTKIYVGRDEPLNWKEAWLFTPAITDPDKPRHENMGVLGIPASLPGISIEVLPLIGAEAKKHILRFENCRVPAKYLIGGPEARGWDVLQASLRSEHGGGGRIVPQESLSSKLIQYCKEHKRNGRPLSDDPAVQDILIQLWIEDEKSRLYTLSTYWVNKSKQWEGKEYKAVMGNLHQKLESPRLAKHLLDILGPYSLTGDKELRVLRGEVERAERMGCVTHIAGTPEALTIMLTRGTGMTAPKEQPKAKGAA